MVGQSEIRHCSIKARTGSTHYSCSLSLPHTHNSVAAALTKRKKKQTKNIFTVQNSSTHTQVTAIWPRAFSSVAEGFTTSSYNSEFESQNERENIYQTTRHHTKKKDNDLLAINVSDVPSLRDSAGRADIISTLLSSLTRGIDMETLIDQSI
jgi:hypothetical protein